MGKRWQLNGVFEAGTSGGPIFSTDGKLLGIVFGGYGAMPVYFAVPIDHFASFFQTAGASLQMCEISQPKAPKEDANGGGGICKGAPITDLHQSAWDYFRVENFSSAKRVARDLLDCNSKDVRAYNVLGSVAFYNRQYDVAIDKFNKALAIERDRSAPDQPGLVSNLADSYAELGLGSEQPERNKNLKLALDLYQSIDDAGETISYKIARVQLALNQISLALSRVTGIPDNYKFEGGRGKARILEGAIHLRSSEPSDEKRLKMAKELFLRGYRKDPEFWKATLLHDRENNAEPFDEIVKAYSSFARDWIRDAELN